MTNPTPEEILQRMYDETLVGNAPEVLDLTQTALTMGMEPQSLLFDALIPSLEEVGARFERGREIFRRVPRRQDDEVRLDADGRLAELAADVRAFEARHVPVEDRDRRGARREQAAARLEAVGDDVDLVTPMLQCPHQQRARNRIVIGHEDLHDGPPGRLDQLSGAAPALPALVDGIRSRRR